MWRLAGGVMQRLMRRQIYMDSHAYNREQAFKAANARNNGDPTSGRDFPMVLAARGVVEDLAMVQ
eukprot:5000853-Pyramimonas_sp.AAC.1